MKLKGTNIDLKLLTEVAALGTALQEEGINFDQFKDKEFDKQLASKMYDLTAEEESKYTEKMNNIMLNLFVKKYNKLKQKFYES